MTDWKENIRNKMSDYSEAAPEGLLDSIMISMDVSRKRRNNIILLTASLAAAAAIAAAVVISPGTGQESGSIPASGRILADRPEIIRIGKMPGAGEIGIIRPDRAPAGDEYIVRQDGKPDGTGNDIPKENVGTSNDDAGNVGKDAGKKDIASGNDSQEQENIMDGGYGWKDLLLAEAGKEQMGKITFGVRASGFTGRGSNYSGYSPAVNMAAAAAPMSYGDNALAGIMTLNRSKEVSTESHHYLPIKAGISVSYAFTPRWSLESGLTYSWLLSKSKTGSESYYVDSRQTLHYLGIPLNVNFHIWQNRWMDVYASAGGMLEKCVGGTIRSDYVYGGNVRDTETEKLNIRPLQWSVGASAGLQFRLSGIVGLYLEPGVIYHFRNGSGVESAYSVHPLNFNLNLGLRFSFREN